MSIKCKLGMHSWDGCICTECNTIRSIGHDTSEDCEKCSKCGTEFRNKHDWSKNCEKCARCGKTREFGHSWKDNCEKCSKCGQTRENIHKMENGVCKVCGHGIFVDKDKKQYQIIRIGDNILMAENYSGKPETGEYWIYEDDTSKLIGYGYLDDFETAVKMAPKGWHLPSKSEWESVLAPTGGDTQNNCENLKPGGHSGFNSVFAGWRSSFGNFVGENASAHFWSSTDGKKNKAWQFKIIAGEKHADFEDSEKSTGLSVRYFKDKG